MQVAVRSLRTKWRFTDFWPEIEKELKATLDGPVKTETTGMLNAIVSEWNHKPDWTSESEVISDGLQLATYAGGKDGQIWQYVNEGTKGPYPIPKSIMPGTILTFQTGYQPRTKPGGVFGGPGKATGPWRRAKQVQHPGIKARDFTGEIQTRYRTTFAKHMKRAMDRATKRIIRRAQ